LPNPVDSITRCAKTVSVEILTDHYGFAVPERSVEQIQAGMMFLRRPSGRVGGSHNSISAHGSEKAVPVCDTTPPETEVVVDPCHSVRRGQDVALAVWQVRADHNKSSVCAANGNQVCRNAGTLRRPV